MYKAGDLVLVPFPFSDLSTQKRRPVLMLSEPDRFGDFICVAITTSTGHSHAIAIDNNSLDEGSLPKSSWIRTDKIFTLDKHLIIRAFGAVNHIVMGHVLDDLCHVIGYASTHDDKL